MGERLGVLLDEEGPSIQVVRAGVRVGSIGDRVPTLVRCIRAGEEYEAVVKAIDGGDVLVTVRNSPS